MPIVADHVTSPAPKRKSAAYRPIPKKIGPDGVYTDADLAIYAAHKQYRAVERPATCNYGEQCWVRFGPPCVSHRRQIECIGCGGRL